VYKRQGIYSNYQEEGRNLTDTDLDGWE